MTFITNSFKISIPSSLDRNILKCWHFILWRHICHHTCIRKYYPIFFYIIRNWFVSFAECFFFHDIKSSRIYQEIVMVTDNMKRPVFWYCTRMDLNQWSYILSGLSGDHWPFLFHVESLNVRVTYWFIITIIKKTYFYSFKRFDTTYK